MFQGELVYVNYGRVEDFKLLVSNFSVNVTGKIVIVRYGRIFRGDKVHLTWLATTNATYFVF